MNKCSLNWLAPHLWNNRLQFLGLHFVGTENGAYEMRAHWYISVLLILSYVISILLTLFKEKFIGLCPLISLTIYVYLYNKCGTIGCQGFNNGIFGGGILRGLAGMAIGICIYEIASYINKSTRSLNYMHINALKLLAWLFLGFIMILRGFTSDDFSAVIPMSLLLLLASIYPMQIFSKNKLPSKIIVFLGKLSYPMFLNHLIISFILSTFFKGHSYYSMLSLFIIGTIVFSVFTQKLIALTLKKN